MRFLQYLGPSDSFDASNILNKPGSVFHTPGNVAVASDLRGNVLQVTNDMATELLTYPNHRFAEVEDTQAKQLSERQSQIRTVREQQEALFASEPANAGILAPSIPDQVAALSTASTETAPSAARSASAIKAETKAESAALSNTAASRPTAPVTGTATASSSAVPATAESAPATPSTTSTVRE